MRVKEIVIDGFKSYAKRTVITDWDPQFNCITGLNGSGKSNILDAICFVLGITTMSTVRAQNQQDLIYKRGQAGVTKASVSIVFDNTDKSKSPLDYRQVDTITVTRQVVLGGTSKYLVNGHRAQQAQVQQLFQEVQLNVNNPNFLIMQGQITKVVNMRPTEILGLIEEAAGTGMYEKERLKAIKEIRDRDLPLHETESLLNEEVRPKLEKLRSQKRQFLEYQQCAASTEALEKILAVSEYNFHQTRLAELEEQGGAKSIEAKNLKAKLVSETERCAQLEAEIQALQAQQRGSQDADALDTQLQEANEEYARSATELEHKQQQLAELQDQISKNQDTVRVLESRLDEYKQSVEAFEAEHAELRSKHDAQHLLVEERRELLSGLQTGISTTGAKETGYAYTTKRARESVASAKQQLTYLHTERERIESELAKPENSRTQSQLTELQSRVTEVADTKRAKQQTLDSLTKQSEEAAALKHQQQVLRDEVARINREIERIMARFPNLDIPGNGQNPQIKGRIAHIFRILDEHRSKSLALEVCGGAGIWSLVVDNEKVGAEVLKRARKRMTVLPLNRMRSQVISRDIVRQIDAQGAWLAIDLLGFDEDVRPAIEYVFGRTVVCATSTIAERAAFKFGVRSVTLEGDVFDPRGVISGGFQGHQRGNGNGNGNGNSNSNSSSIFGAVSQYHTLVQEKLDAETKMAEVETKVKSVGNAALVAEQTRNELALVEHEFVLAQNRLTECERNAAQLAALESTLSDITSRQLREAEQLVATSEAALAKALKDTAEFNANRETKLKELQEEVRQAVSLETELSQHLERQASQHSKNQSELARLAADLDQEQKELAANTKNRDELQISVDTLVQTTLPQLTDAIARLDAALKAEMSRQASTRHDMQAREKELIELQSSVAEMRLQLQQASHDEEKMTDLLTQARNSLQAVLKRWSWAPELAATTVSANGGPSGGGGNIATKSLSQLSQPMEIVNSASEGSEHQLEQIRQNFAQEKRRLQSLASRVDSSVVTMIERLETDEIQLRQRIDTIREDRRKLEESMDTLNERRRKTIDKVWRQVSKDFGLIFGDLLPRSSCELVPLSDQPIQNGFSLRVRLGETWKDGLTELSGGQRSLVALALILALLRYHPAPVYILDEVDAALDVHHTRNIGHIIKTRFQNAQFIVVSLKDDMFTNANRIYQTRFVDGTSTVAIVS